MTAETHRSPCHFPRPKHLPQPTQPRTLFLSLALALTALLAGFQLALADPGDAGDLPGPPPAFQELGQEPMRSPGQGLIVLDRQARPHLGQELWQDVAQAGRIQEYVVQPGDTVWSIAAQHDLTLDSLRWANPELRRNPDKLAQGQILRIPPVNGALHDVQPGDTVESIAAAWNVPPETIRAYRANRLAGDRQPAPGDVVIVPYGAKEVDLPAPTPVAGYSFAWPINGWLSQGYHSRHHALDIAGPYGAKVYASRAGRVIHTGWDPSGYGYLVKIQHEGGYVSYYGHLKGHWVQKGQWVAQGDLIGEVGSTGNSTGPHVHFEIRRNGAWVNPLNYLPPR